MNMIDGSPAAAGARFRGLTVIAKVRESSSITSFHLEPVDPASWQDFEPGQFLVFRIPNSDKGRDVPRTYSVSSARGRPGRYRITVKREPALGSERPVGLASGYLHDDIQVGDVLMAQGPRGEFVLDRASPRPVVLLSGGVGLTPLVSMLHDLAQGSDQRVHFIHACDNGDVHALRDEVLELASSRPGISAHFVYRTPTREDRANTRFHHEGLVTKSLLQTVLCLDDYDVYLCGPSPFMQAVFGLLRELGVPKSRIAYEFFGPAAVLDTDAKPAIAIPPPASMSVRSGEGPLVEFRRSGISAMWDAKSQSLLSFAEEQGLSPAFSCRAGICGTCISSLIAGSVTYIEEPLDEVAQGRVLLCCSRPQGSVVVDL
jgi:uncharacterized protein